MGKLNLYRNISITFVIFAAMILCALFLTFYTQATIIVTPDAQVVNLNFNAEVRTSSTPEELAKLDAIKGAITTTEIQSTGTFDVLSTKASSGSGNSNIVGSVKVFNNGKTPQTLVKTTQLQADNGAIVRTNGQVVVPAGGSVNVDVFPKDPATFQSIDPGKLVIIKLPVATQKLVYAQAEDALTVRTDSGGDIKFLADSDVNKAKKELIDKAVAQAISDNGGKNTNIVGEVMSYTLDKKLGDETEKFTISARIRLKSVIADQNQLAAMIKKRAQTANLQGAAPAEINPDSIRYAIVTANSNTSFNIKVSYPLTTELANDSDVLSKENFAGKTISEIKAYASKTGSIKEVEVVISPYWRKTTPKDLSRIKVIIK